MKVFSCPSCHGTHFGTQDFGVSPWVRECHDQLKQKCKWRGGDAECFVQPEVALARLSRAVDKALDEVKK